MRLPVAVISTLYLISNILDRRWKSWFPRSACRAAIRRVEKRRTKALLSMQWFSNQEFRQKINQDLWELGEWQQALDDEDLVKKGERLDVYLDEVDIPDNPEHDDRRTGHYEIGTFGDKYLQAEPRRILIKRIRERLPAYRKERREIIDTWAKIATSLVAVLGAVTGLVAVVLTAMK